MLNSLPLPVVWACPLEKEIPLHSRPLNSGEPYDGFPNWVGVGALKEKIVMGYNLSKVYIMDWEANQSIKDWRWMWFGNHKRWWRELVGGSRFLDHIPSWVNSKLPCIIPFPNQVIIPVCSWRRSYGIPDGLDVLMDYWKLPSIPFNEVRYFCIP